MTPDKPNILVVGSVNMDLVLQMDRVPSPGENLLGKAYSWVCGGKGGNQAVAAARLGGEVTFVGRVGADAHGGELKRSLAAEGIDVRLVGEDSEAATGLAVIMVEGGGRNRIVVYAGANMVLAEGHLEEAFERPCDALMLQLEIPDSVVAAAVRKARAAGVAVVLDAGPARPFELSLVRGVDVLSPNQSEAAALSGLPCGTVAEAERAARRLAERAESPNVVIKLGADGALWYSGGSARHFAPCRVDAVDPTAAGDAFTAAMTVAWCRRGDLADAVAYGNAAGALAATRLGAQPSLPTRAQMEGFRGAGE